MSARGGAGTRLAGRICAMRVSVPFVVVKKRWEDVRDVEVAHCFGLRCTRIQAVVVVGERAGAGASCVLMRRGGGTRVEICAIARNRDVLLRTGEIYTTSPYVTAAGECMSISRGYSLCRRMVPRSENVRA